jgi:hypothetical protein
MNRLSIQLQMFTTSYKYTNFTDAVDIMKSVQPEVRELFSEVCTLMRLLLVLPSSSCEAERSFSALRRLKTYLRSTMTQKRLNNVAVCHIHCERLRRLEIGSIINDFISLNDSRAKMFGQYK